jgi:hypothetical protein
VAAAVLVVLELEYCEPWSEPLQQLATALGEKLPRLSVFASGSQAVTLHGVVQESDLLPHLDEFQRALDQFTQTARTLVERLASVLQVSPTSLGESWRALAEAQRSGCLDDRWDYYFHGSAVQFQDLQTGSILDVRLKDWGQRGALFDPFFVGMFVRSTPGFEALAQLLPHLYHDTSRALALLHARSIGTS